MSGYPHICDHGGRGAHTQQTQQRPQRRGQQAGQRRHRGGRHPGPGLHLRHQEAAQEIQTSVIRQDKLHGETNGICSM